MHTIRMPRLDIDMEKGTVTEWMKKEGDQVQKGETIAKIMSEKVTFEIESPTSGILFKIIIPQDVEVSIKQVIGVIMEPGDDPSNINTAIKEAKENFAQTIGEKVSVKKIVDVGKVSEEELSKVRITPLAKKIAAQYDIDITKIKGSGPRGRIVRKDILMKVEELEVKQPHLEPIEVIPLQGVRKVVAERMASSFHTAPHASIIMKVDMSEVIKLRQHIEKEKNVQVSYNALFTMAVARSLQEYPILNSLLEQNSIKIMKDINIGIAVATERGLIVPTVYGANKKGLIELNTTVDELIEKTKKDKLLIRDVVGGTFTITNLGMFGVEAFIAIINPKQAAILAIGRIADEPQVVNGQIAIKPIVTLSLSFDHRIVDGAPASQFLNRIKQILESPLQLINQ